MLTLTAGIAAYCLDLLWGEPGWLSVPTRLMRRYARWYGRKVRPRFPMTRRGEFRAGLLFAVSLPALALLAGQGLCAAAERIHPAALFLAQTLLCWQSLSVRGLARKGRSVWQKLWEEDLPGARTALARISERDTDRMSRSAVIRATVETIAEGFPWDAALPMLAFFLGGGPLALCCQAICVADRVMERRTPRESAYGRASGVLAAAIRYLPARVAALFWILSAHLTGHNAIRALRIWFRERRNPDAAGEIQTASACAGALGIRLGGSGWYQGRLRELPALGDDRRPVQRVDLLRTIRMLDMASFLLLDACAAARLAAVWIHMALS